MSKQPEEPDLRAMLEEAFVLLQDGRPNSLDPGHARSWGRRRKALVNKIIELRETSDAEG